MSAESELIVLHYTRTGDRSVVVHTLSREYGRRAFLFKSIGNGSMMTMFQPLSILECSISENTRSLLFTARHPVLVSPLYNIRGNLYKNSISVFIGEVLFRMLKEGTDDPGLFDWCKNNILLLDAVETDFSNFHIRFLLELAVVMGFAPSVSDLEPFTGDDAGIMELFLTGTFEQTMLLPMSGKVRARLASGLLRYLEFHTETSLNINSLGVLQELMG